MNIHDRICVKSVLADALKSYLEPYEKYAIFWQLLSKLDIQNKICIGN